VGRWLFHPEEGEDWKLEDDHLAKMMEITGQTFPTKMLERAKLRKEYFDDAGMPVISVLIFLWSCLISPYMVQVTSCAYRS
jgi:hypothetical protein